MSDIRTDITYVSTGDAEFGDYIALLKPRVMSLVVFTALVGLLVAPGGLHPMRVWPQSSSSRWGLVPLVR